MRKITITEIKTQEFLAMVTWRRKLLFYKAVLNSMIFEITMQLIVSKYSLNKTKEKKTTSI